MRVSLCLGLTLLVLSGAARAVEFQATTRGGVLWDSNVGNASTDQDEEDDFSLNGAVDLMLRSDPRSTDFTWEFLYRPRYEKFIDLDDFDNLSHTALGRFDYQFTDTTSFSGLARWTQTDRTSRRQAEGDEPDPGDPETSRGDQQVDRLNLSLVLSHLLTPRWTLDSRISYDMTLYERDSEADYFSIGGFAQALYALTRRQSLGGGVAFTHQTLDDTPIQQGQDTDYGTAFAAWTYQITPLWSTSVRAGPSFIRSDEQDQPDNVSSTDIALLLTSDQCPALKEGDLFSLGFDTFFTSDQCGTVTRFAGPESISLQLTNRGSFDAKATSVTGFAVASLSRRGEKSNFTVDFRRTQGENFGGRQSQIENILGTSFSWRPTQKWSFLVGATWSLRESATDSSTVVPVLVAPNPADPRSLVLGVPDDLLPGNVLPSTGLGCADLGQVSPCLLGETRAVDADNAVDITTYTLRFRATRRFSRRLSGFVAGSWRLQDNQGDFLGTGRETESFEAAVGVEYQFDPIQF